MLFCPSRCRQAASRASCGAGSPSRAVSPGALRALPGARSPETPVGSSAGRAGGDRRRLLRVRKSPPAPPGLTPRVAPPRGRSRPRRLQLAPALRRPVKLAGSPRRRGAPAPPPAQRAPDLAALRRSSREASRTAGQVRAHLSASDARLSASARPAPRLPGEHPRSRLPAGVPITPSLGVLIGPHGPKGCFLLIFPLLPARL